MSSVVVKELDNEQRPVTCDAERAFRRGYYLGFKAALDALWNGQHKKADLGNFLLEELYDWRYCDSELYTDYSGTTIKREPPVLQ